MRNSHLLVIYHLYCNSDRRRCELQGQCPLDEHRTLELQTWWLNKFLPILSSSVEEICSARRSVLRNFLWTSEVRMDSFNPVRISVVREAELLSNRVSFH